MAETTAEKIKYRILRFLDITGFTVFDPMVRLAFGEEPKKQTEAISKYFFNPDLICDALHGAVVGDCTEAQDEIGGSADARCGLAGGDDQ